MKANKSPERDLQREICLTKAPHPQPMSPVWTQYFMTRPSGLELETFASVGESAVALPRGKNLPSNFSHDKPILRLSNGYI